MHRLSLLVASLTLLLAALMIEANSAPALAAAPNRVALVVTHGDGTVVTRCVTFSESEISGLAVLTRSGLAVEYASGTGQGEVVTLIDGEGCPADDPWCAGREIYWSYWHLKEGAWEYSPVGASLYRVGDGDVEGWAWGRGNPPALASHEQVCADAATPTATVAPGGCFLPLIWRF